MERFKNSEYYVDQLTKVGAKNILSGIHYTNTPANNFLYTRKLLMKYDILPKKLLKNKVNPLLTMSKCRSFRIKANEFFEDKDYLSALKNYTISLMNSRPGTEIYAYILSNRSLTFFHLNKYEQCLQDIRRAFESNYPAKQAFKLYEQAGNAERLLGCGDAAKTNYMKCLKHLDSLDNNVLSDELKNEYKTRVKNAIGMCEGLVKYDPIVKKKNFGNLLGGKNENIPAISAFLELKCSKTMGRGVYATCDINPGDIVLIEEPYIGSPYPAVPYVCNYTGCLKLSLAIIPCPTCLTVFYCDEYCMQMDENDGHIYQCPLMYSIKQIAGIPKLNELVLKIFLKEYIHMGIQEYCSVVNNLSETTIDPETRGFVDGQYKSEHFFTAYSMEGYEKKITNKILFLLNCIAAEILEYLMLSGFHIPESDITIIGASFVHMLIILDLYSWKLSMVNCPSVNIIANTNFLVTTACALYPSMGLFNHSCDPNVKRSGILSARTNVLTAVQPISKGSQLFISYGISFTKYSKEMREHFFETCAMFKCQCQPCVENWPWGRFVPNRLSPLSLLNKSLKDTISLECSKFLEYLEKVKPADSSKHLEYLYNLAKLLAANVKRPYTLYEDCIGEISSGQVVPCNDDFEYTCVEDNWLCRTDNFN